MKKIAMLNHSLSVLVLVGTVSLLSACAATKATPQSNSDALADKTGFGHGSEVPGQLDDGGWVMNTPGKVHTHKVLLAECPERPIVTRHTHDHLHDKQTVQSLGAVAHKHAGCFICPPKNSLVKRITSH